MNKFVIGDVVKTLWGNAVVTKSENGLHPYAVDHLPGHSERVWDGPIGYGPKHAWYADDELQMVAESSARAFLK